MRASNYFSVKKNVAWLCIHVVFFSIKISIMFHFGSVFVM